VQERIKKATRIICQSKQTLALTGAGISVESGIPDFRSPGGLWERFDPMEYATIEAFRADPEKVWRMLQEVAVLLSRARPNPAHTGLGRLQQMGLLHTIITQNIDNLHQEGGATRVIEYHGNSKTLSCLGCNERYSAPELEEQVPPKCGCGKILKPDVVFFGEPIPTRALQDSYELASTCDTLLVLGTSAEVAPANTIPQAAKMAGATIIEVNLAPTVLTNYLSDIFLEGKASEVVTRLVQEIRQTDKFAK
jgi:NAD-dependent deacetylase